MLRLRILVIETLVANGHAGVLREPQNSTKQDENPYIFHCWHVGFIIACEIPKLQFYNMQGKERERLENKTCPHLSSQK